MDDKEPNHDDSSPTSTLVGWPLMLVLGEDDGDDEMAKTHSKSTESQSRSSSDSVNVQNGRNGCNQHYNADHAGREERDSVGRQPEGLEDLGRVVQDGVDTCPLLEEHGHSGDNDSAEHGHSREERCHGYELKLDGVHRRQFGQMREFLGDGAPLKQRLGLDLEELELHKFGFNGQRSQCRKGPACFFLPTVVNEPTRSERHPDHADQQNQSWEELEGKRHEPSGLGLGRPCASDVVCAIILAFVS